MSNDVKRIIEITKRNNFLKTKHIFKELFKNIEKIPNFIAKP